MLLIAIIKRKKTMINTRHVPGTPLTASAVVWKPHDRKFVPNIRSNRTIYLANDYNVVQQVYKYHT